MKVGSLVAAIALAAATSTGAIPVLAQAKLENSLVARSSISKTIEVLADPYARLAELIPGLRSIRTKAFKLDKSSIPTKSINDAERQSMIARYSRSYKHLEEMMRTTPPGLMDVTRQNSQKAAGVRVMRQPEKQSVSINQKLEDALTAATPVPTKPASDSVVPSAAMPQKAVLSETLPTKKRASAAPIVEAKKTELTLTKVEKYKSEPVHTTKSAYTATKRVPSTAEERGKQVVVGKTSSEEKAERRPADTDKVVSSRYASNYDAMEKIRQQSR